MTPQEIFYIIDGNAYIYRAYHALSPLSTKTGLPTHAVFGFTKILLRVIREKQPGLLAVTFDPKGPNFRHELYPEYKANRPPMPEDLVVQLPYVREIVRAHNICCLEKEGVEADDIIATAGRFYESRGKVVIISGDKDLLQLVSDRIEVWDPMNDKVWDLAAVEKKYNVPAEKLLDFFALVGDKSDNVPGVPGVGAKTSEKLINEFGSLEGLYADLEKVGAVKLREKLAANRDQAFLSRDLIALKQDVDIPRRIEAYRFSGPDIDRLRTLYKELEFTRLAKSELPAQTLDASGFTLVQSEAELDDLCKQLFEADCIVLDTETTSLDTLTAKLVGISLCSGPDKAFYVPVGHRNEDGTLASGQMDSAVVLAKLRPLLENSHIPKLGHNLKFDYAVLTNYEIDLQGPLWDTMIASYLLEPSRRTHKLDDLSEEVLERRLTTFSEVTGGDKREDCFASVPLAAAKDYSCEDVRAAFLLWEVLQPQLEEKDLWALFSDVEMKLVPILSEMERNGIIVDRELLSALSVEFAGKIDELEQEIYGLAGKAFNINSPRQLAEVLFDELKLPRGRKTKTGYSTDVKVLEKLARKHEMPAKVILLRTLAKLKSTYVDKLSTLTHPVTGRVHTSFNQTVTATGRLSSSKPNLQNIPIRTEEGQRIREAFVPAPGHIFLAADYSQIDLRVLAHYSQDEALLAAFRSGEDIHNRTAAEIFLVNPHFITKAMRRVAKSINFGIVYGMSAFGLATQLDLSRKEASTFIKRYFDHYAGVKKFMEEIVVKAKKDGFVTTLLHRRRPLPDIESPNKTKREFAERTAINTPIQGTAADIIKLATLAAVKGLKENNLTARLLLQIHDELVFEVPESEVTQTSGLIKEAMEDVLELDVPLVVNITTGKNLAAT